MNITVKKQLPGKQTCSEEIRDYFRNEKPPEVRCFPGAFVFKAADIFKAKFIAS